MTLMTSNFGYVYRSQSEGPGTIAKLLKIVSTVLHWYAAAHGLPEADADSFFSKLEVVFSPNPCSTWSDGNYEKPGRLGASRLCSLVVQRSGRIGCLWILRRFMRCPSSGP